MGLGYIGVTLATFMLGSGLMGSVMGVECKLVRMGVDMLGSSRGVSSMALVITITGIVYSTLVLLMCFYLNNGGSMLLYVVIYFCKFLEWCFWDLSSVLALDFYVVLGVVFFRVQCIRSLFYLHIFLFHNQCHMVFIDCRNCYWLMSVLVSGFMGTH